MNADERLALIFTKVVRAERHLTDITTTLKTFSDSNPYKMGTKQDPITRQLVYYFENVTPLPNEVSILAGEIIQHLRTALDHLAYQMVLVGSGVTAINGQTCFFIASSAHEFKRHLANKSQGMRPNAIEAIRDLEPYKGGKGNQFWILHKLNNIDKHRLLLTVAGQLQSVNIGAIMTAGMKELHTKMGLDDPPEIDLFVRPAGPLEPIKIGDPILGAGPDAKPIEKMSARIDIAIHEPGIVEGEPLLKTLLELRDLVSSTVSAFKTFLK